MLLLLDRDGVINEDLPTGVRHWDEFTFLPHALEALALLRHHQVNIAIITNQSVIGKGWCSEDELNHIHSNMCAEIEAAGGKIHHIYYCPDHPDAPTHNRKPNPGMIEQALHDFDAKAEDAPMVGDSLRDLQAAARAGCPRYLVKTGKGAMLAKEAFADELKPVKVFDDIMSVARFVTGVGNA